MLVRQQGTKASIYLYNPTQSQLDAARDTEGICAVGVRIRAGSAPLDDNGDVVIYLDYYDDAEYEKNHLPAITDIHGSYPVGKDEVMMSLDALTALNIESVSDELKKEDDNIIVKGRNKGYMIIAGGLTTLLVLFYCII